MPGTASDRLRVRSLRAFYSWSVVVECSRGLNALVVVLSVECYMPSSVVWLACLLFRSRRGLPKKV